MITSEYSKEVEDRIVSSLEPIDAESRYADMLDEVYSFGSVGGPFENMRPSAVLREMDNTDFRCGLNDWLDGEDVVEINGDYYDARECEEIADDVKAEQEDKANGEVA